MVEAFIAPGFFAPFAGEQPLALQTAKQRVERALVHVEAVFGEELAERVAVLLRPQRGEHREHEATAAQFEPEIFKQRWIQGSIPCEA